MSVPEATQTHQTPFIPSATQSSPSNMFVPPSVPSRKSTRTIHDFISVVLLEKDPINFKEDVADSSWYRAYRHKDPLAYLKLSSKVPLRPVCTSSTAQHPQADGQSERMIQNLEDIMRACVIDLGGSYHLSIQCAPFEALYGRKYRSPVLWAEIGESSLTGLELVQETTDKVVLVKEKPKAARDRQKSYVDYKHKPLEFEVGDRAFEILERIGLVAYRLRLPEDLNNMYDTFHVSNLKMCLADANLHVPLDKIKVDRTLHFVEEPLEVMDREIKKLVVVGIKRLHDDLGVNTAKITTARRVSTVRRIKTRERIKMKIVYQDYLRDKRKQRKDTEDPQLSGPTEPVTNDTENVESVPTHSNDPLLSGKDRLKLNELLELCTSLSQRVLALATTKTNQALEIDSLKRRVKKLEKKKGSRTHRLKRLFKVGRSAQVVSSEDEGLGAQEDASKQGRKNVDLDADAEVTLIDETQGRNDDNLMFDTGVFDEQEVEVEKVVSTVEVTTASATTTTVDELTLAQTLIEIKAAKPKVVTTAATTTTTAVTRPKARGVVVQAPSEFTTTTSPS
ncbi:putative reverse transcriptase domain-containing protein [Tanacetum coccineum]